MLPKYWSQAIINIGFVTIFRQQYLGKLTITDVDSIILAIDSCIEVDESTHA